MTFEEMQWKWKECEHSAVKIACPPPCFILVRHIEQVCLDGLLPLLANLKPCEDGVGVIGLESQFVGESKAASDNLSLEGAAESSRVLGT